MPIVVKGILRADDAELAIKYGVAGIAVSNHGGRQLDGVQASIDALPAIVKQVNGRCEVFVDGGITRGTDVLKALALGAKIVMLIQHFRVRLMKLYQHYQQAFIGRPAIWGLAHSGEEGVKCVVQLLKDELDTAMALSGITYTKLPF